MRTAIPIAPLETPEDEMYRLGVLANLSLLDTPPEAEFDSLVQIARHVLDCPMALVSLVDVDRQWFKARCGIDVSETPRDVAFCDYAIRQPDMLVVNDATRDPRFAGNPLVTGEPHIRFYAGMPIRIALEDGQPAATIGTLCVIDMVPRILSGAQVEMLRHLASLAETIIRGRLHIANAVRYGEEKREAAARLSRQQRLFEQAERMANMGSWRLMLDTNTLNWSDHVFAIHGLPLGTPPAIDRALDYYPDEARARIEAAVARTVETGQPFDLEADFHAADGGLKRIRTIGEVELVDGQPVSLIGVFQDVTEHYVMEQVLRRSARQDALTGIANRAGFNAALDSAMTRARGDGSSLALALIDLDGFKQVNDVHGHRAGDELLKEIAHRLESPLLANCVAARLGGDEFALIVNDAEDCAAIASIAEHVLGELRRPVAISDGDPVTVAGTIGIAWFECGLPRAELMHRADLALYEAKRAGKGIARCWQPGSIPPGEPHGRRKGSRC